MEVRIDDHKKNVKNKKTNKKPKNPHRPKSALRSIHSKTMYRQIDVDCQTKGNSPHCSDCIFVKTCPSQQRTDSEKKETGISVVDPETVGVWKKWNKRKSLTT